MSTMQQWHSNRWQITTIAYISLLALERQIVGHIRHTQNLQAAASTGPALQATEDASIIHHFIHSFAPSVPLSLNPCVPSSLSPSLPPYLPPSLSLSLPPFVSPSLVQSSFPLPSPVPHGDLEVERRQECRVGHSDAIPHARLHAVHPGPPTQRAAVHVQRGGHGEPGKGHAGHALHQLRVGLPVPVAQQENLGGWLAGGGAGTGKRRGRRGGG